MEEMKMKKVVSFSGGRTSAYLCHLMKEKYGDEVDFIYMDTGAEHKETYEFIRRVDAKFGLDLVCLRTDFSSDLGVGNDFTVVGIDSISPDLKPFREMIAKYGVPYIGGMFCTDRMKLVPFKKYCDEKYGKGNYETWLGIRADEPKRLTPKNCVRYLAEISDFEKSDILEFWRQMPFDLEIEEWNGNCVFCPKKSNLKLVAAQRDNPELYHDYLAMLYSDSVRVDNKTGHWSQMYRGKKSLEQVVAMFDGSTGDEIKARIRGAKMTDAGSCSESCEVFNCSI
jgi:hypothetical protein